MSLQTLNSCLKNDPGYWNPFIFLTEMREQKVITSSNLTVPTYITLVFHAGETKFFRISRKLLMKIREVCPSGNIADYLWQVRAIRERPPFFSYDVKVKEMKYYGWSEFLRGVNLEVLIAEANTMLDTIPNIAPRLESVMDTNGREIGPEVPAVPKFGRKILI